jgi:hypothetical protein
MQPHVKQMDVFVRTPVWFAEIAGHGGENHDCKKCDLSLHAQYLTTRQIYLKNEKGFAVTPKL